MKRSNLMAARIKAGYNSQQEFVEYLNSKDYDISIHEYGNIENGRKKEIGINIALTIARQLNKMDELDTLFLLSETYKLRNDLPKSQAS